MELQRKLREKDGHIREERQTFKQERQQAGELIKVQCDAEFPFHSSLLSSTLSLPPSLPLSPLHPHLPPLSSLLPSFPPLSLLSSFSFTPSFPFPYSQASRETIHKLNQKLEATQKVHCSAVERMTLQWQRQLKEAEKDCERMKVRTEGEVGAKED